MKKLSKKQKLIILTAIVIILVIISLIIGANIIRINIINSSYNSANNNSSSGNLLPEYIKEGITLGGVTGTLVDLDTSDATATEWDITYGKTAYVNGEKITGIFVPRSSLKVGDYVSYTPDIASAYSLSSTVSGHTSNQTISQDTSLAWQILSINDDGTLDLISNTTVESIIHFGGALGYNNAVYVLNDICKKQYSNNEFGAIGRSIKIEDIENKINEKGLEAIKSSYDPTETYKYGTIKTYTNQRYYPNLYAQENGGGIDTTQVKTNGIGRSDSYYTEPTKGTYTQASSLLTVTQDYYALIKTDDYFDDVSFYNLIFGKNRDYVFYIASRCSCSQNDGMASFFLRRVSNGGLRNVYMYVSGNYEHSDNAPEYQGTSIRPIVTLEPNIKIYGGDGSAEHPYQLTT